MGHFSAQEGYMPVPGGRAWYRFTAPQPSIPLVTLQGGPGTSPGHFEPLVTLSEERPVVLYDALESGAADGPACAQKPCSCSIDRFREVRSALGLTRIHVLGYGWGALAALEYALTQPEGLVSLILDPVDPAAFINYVCLSLQARVTHPPQMTPPRDTRLTRLGEIRVPALLVWEAAESREHDASRCDGRLLPGWQLSVRPAGVGTPDHDEWFTRAVRRFLASVEGVTVGVETSVMD